MLRRSASSRQVLRPAWGYGLAVVVASAFALDHMSSSGGSPPPDGPELTSLLQAAREARAGAYAPYSRFPVGAAILTESGEVFTGCNVENASYGLALCAERVAVGKAVSEGSRRFRAIAVLGPQDDRPCYPCGSCRQVLFEFAPDLLVITAGSEQGGQELTPLRELLPRAFLRDTLDPSSQVDRP
jgi:cytidine deaminase